MKKIKKHKDISVFIAIMLTLLGFSGCSSNSSEAVEKYGVDIVETEVTSIKEILTNSDDYLNQTVRLEGEITRECPSGCWFFMEDTTGTIYIDINPSGIAIPPRVGARVIVEGIVVNKNGRTSVIGKGVEF